MKTFPGGRSNIYTICITFNTLDIKQDVTVPLGKVFSISYYINNIV